MCNMDCLHCQKPDCDNDRITDAERKQQNDYDKEEMRGRIAEERTKKGKLAEYDYLHSDKGKAKQKKYNSSEKGKTAQKRYTSSDKGKAAQTRYNHSEKGAETRKRYEKSEKGKARNRRASQKKVASGKNAEYCRAYYQRKKAEREAATCKA